MAGWPEHPHCLLELPAGDADFAVRGRRIKAGFSQRLPLVERRSAVRRARGKHGLWQRRYWEPLIRNDEDFRASMDSLHFNPVKHGHVDRVVDGPYSTFHRRVAAGVYSADWAGSAAADGLRGPD
jgi:putative transposase